MPTRTRGQESSRTSLPGLWAKRLRMRSLRAGDEEFLARLDTDSEVMRYIHSGPLGSQQALRWSTLQVQMAIEERPWPRRWGKWIVQKRRENEAIGWVELSKFSTRRGDFLSVGYQFAPEFWGNGYATEAVATVVSYVFRRLGDPYVFAYAQPANVASLRVLEKVGFARTKRTIRDEGRNVCVVLRKRRVDA